MKQIEISDETFDMIDNLAKNNNLTHAKVLEKLMVDLTDFIIQKRKADAVRKALDGEL